ncbi:MAG TPA: hypothetical protein VF042_16245, partial [Gemmatimonadaceae bacterium]
MKLAPSNVMRVLPTPRAARLIAFTAPVWLLAGNRWGLLAAVTVTSAVVIVILFDLIRLPGASAIAISRNAPGTGGLTDAIEASYHIVSRWNRRIEGVLYHAIPRELGPSMDLVHFTISPGDRASIDFTLTPTRRGRWELGAIAARIHSPLGFVQRNIAERMADAITIAPSLKPVRNYQLMAMQHRL